MVSGVAFGVAVGMGVAFVGCLSRPVVAEKLAIQQNFTIDANGTSIDKIDILFDIDNSASMGDKQAYLSAAIPDLITRLVTPNCLDSAGTPIVDGSGVGVKANPDGSCPPGAGGVVGQVEFPPVRDMHIGILSSSLGTRGSTPSGQFAATCDPAQVQFLTGTGNMPDPTGPSLPSHTDDRAHLLNRSSPPMNLDNEVASPATGTSNFLYWYPSANTAPAAPPTSGAPVTADAGALESDFEDLVAGVHQFGCGIESQLETWYRFLVQPDPYASIVLNGSGNAARAAWSGVDSTILQQRHDFLRPDSLVVIVVLSDENDSEVDVRALGGIGFNFMNGSFQPFRGTSACSNPNDPACVSCGLPGAPANDPSCAINGGVYSAPDDWGYDLNLRHVHQKQKYGISVQFPIERYLLGLTSAKVPDRDNEYPSGAQSYQGLVPAQQNCVNPLFAASLPDGSDTSAGTLCNLSAGARQPGSNLVYYAHIGGVPHELLQEDATDPESPQKATLSPADWTKILGNDPVHYDFTGIDSHMIESSQPRSGAGLSAPGSAEGADPINGREWVTDGTSGTVPFHRNLAVDREYACIFKLQDAKGNPTPRQCDPSVADPATGTSCDCGSTGLDRAHLPAVCNYTEPASNPGTQQDYAKAYPTVRELLLAKLLDTQGIISSLCPIHVQDNQAGNDPLYGYRPAITAIVDRLSTALQHQPLPQKLTPDNDAGHVPCLVLATLPNAPAGDESICTNASEFPSLEKVDPAVLQLFQTDQHAAFLQGGSVPPDLSTFPTCQVQQILPAAFQGNCTTLTDPQNQGWCYVVSPDAGTQALYFTPNGLPQGAKVKLQCIEASPTFGTTGGTAGVGD
jgi:hypothetical protein